MWWRGVVGGVVWRYGLVWWSDVVCTGVVGGGWEPKLEEAVVEKPC